MMAAGPSSMAATFRPRLLIPAIPRQPGPSPGPVPTPCVFDTDRHASILLPGQLESANPPPLEIQQVLQKWPNLMMQSLGCIENSSPTCPVCQKSFPSESRLTGHMATHTNAKPFVCHICKKAFKFRSNLCEHRSIHQGTMPYRCKLCGKTARLKGNLKKHLRTHLRNGEVNVDFNGRVRKKRASRTEEQPGTPQVPAQPSTPSHPVSPLLCFESPDVFARNLLARTLPPRRDHANMTRLTRDVKLQYDLSSRLSGDFRELLQRDEMMSRLYHEFKRLPLSHSFGCTRCQLHFIDRAGLLRHLSTHEGCTHCLICLQSFPSLASMEQHEALHRRVMSLVDVTALPQVMNRSMMHQNSQTTQINERKTRVNE